MSVNDYENRIGGEVVNFGQYECRSAEEGIGSE